MEQFIVSRDDEIYEAFPDVALTLSQRLVCVFAECTHHRDRSYTRVMMITSDDRGRTWSAKSPISDALRGDPKVDPWWNCPRVSCLSDGRLIVVCDRIAGRGGGNIGGEQSNWIWISDDGGDSWSGPRATPVVGIVPDQLIELRHADHAGRWLLGAHTRLPPAETPLWSVRTWLSDDAGESWQGPFPFPLPGCHRPVAGMVDDDLMLITHRYMQGGKGWVGWRTQNFFGALTDLKSCRARRRQDAHTRILPIDFDRHFESDTG